MNNKQLRKKFKKELGELTEADKRVLDADERMEEVSKIISGSA